MKQIIACVLSLTLLLSLTACGAKPAVPPAPGEAPVVSAPAAPEPETNALPQTVERHLQGVDLRVQLPEDWRAAPIDADAAQQLLGGLRLQPADGTASYDLNCYDVPFGICGTGVTFEDVKLSSGVTVNQCTEEINGSVWLTVFFPDTDCYFVLQSRLPADEWQAQRETLLAILGTFTYTLNDIGTAEEQLRVIAAHREEWMPMLDYADEYSAFAVTDLDQNGRLEVIASQMGGTGHYTYSRFFEVNESMDGLTECGRPDAGEGDSEADLLLFDRVPCYSDGGVRYYIFEDTMKVSAREYYDAVIALSLQSGEVRERLLAYRRTEYDAGGEQVTCFDAADAEITQEAYDAIAAETFRGAEPVSAELHWHVLQDTSEWSDEQFVENCLPDLG